MDRSQSLLTPTQISGLNKALLFERVQFNPLCITLIGHFEVTKRGETNA